MGRSQQQPCWCRPPLLLAVGVALLLAGGGWNASPFSSSSSSTSSRSSLVVMAARSPTAPLHTVAPPSKAAASVSSSAAAAAAEGIDLILSRRGGAKGPSSAMSSGGGKRGPPGGKGKGKPAAVSLDEDDEDDEDEDDKEWGEDDEEEGEDEEGYGDDEEYEEEEDEEEEMEESPRGRQQQPRKGAANDWHYADRRRRMRARTSNSMGIAGLIKGAAKLTGNSVSKVAGLFQPNKYVGLREVIGVWKMKQKVSERPGELERCEATVEIRRDGSVATFFEGRELVSEFLFKERQWPRSCIVEFEAKAFQGPYDREPQLMFYKGYVKRGLVNSKQVRIEGKIYDVKGTFFWRQKKQVGRFRAIKR